MIKKGYLYVLFQVAGWGGYALLLAIYYVVNNLTGIRTIISISAASILGLVISHGLRAIMKTGKVRSIPAVRLVPIGLLLCIVSGLLLILSSSLVELMVYQLSGWNFPEPDIRYYFTAWLNSTLLFLLWLIIYMATYYFRNYRQGEIDLLKREAYTNELELNVLRSQMNPHFMFNALNSIRALIDEEPDGARQAIGKLGRLLRQSLLSTKKDLIPLAEEIHNLEDFLSLEKLRYEERLTYEIDIPKSLESVQIPPMILQTLVENAVKHGIAKSVEGGTIEIKGEDLGESIQILISNPGTLSSNGEGTGIGLSTTERRLAILYGKRAHFSLLETEPSSVEAKLIVPKYIIYGKDTHPHR